MEHNFTVKEENTNKTRQAPPPPPTNPSVPSANFMQVISDSHFWPSIEILLNNFKTNPKFYKFEDREYYIKGLENTLKQGYDIVKINNLTSGFETNPLIIDMQETFNQCLEIVKKKNADYSGKETQDPYKNIKNSISIGVNPEQGVLVRMMDKMSRISNLLTQEAEVKSESIDDTLDDLINYAAILKSYIKHGR